MSDRRAQLEHKDISLEAVRGLAAIVVVFWHSLLAFFPQRAGIYPEYSSTTWQTSPLFFLINGESAVALFFVLSGYVLTRRYFSTGDASILLRGAVKRWPRLIGPVLAAVLVSYLFFNAGFYAYEDAGQVSGSPWLESFASAFPGGSHPEITLWSALKQGIFAVFFRGDNWFDTSLWTMRPEFIGSFVALCVAPVLYEARKQSGWLIFYLAACVAVLAHFSMPNLVAFPVGVFISAVLPSGQRAPKYLAYVALLISFYLMGYSGKHIGAYSIFGLYYPYEEKYYIYPAIAGSAILICILETFPPLKQRFSGRYSRWLGEFSFPIYLMHVLVICSFGSKIYLKYGAITAVLAVLLITPVAAYPLLLFNRAWVTAVTNITRAILRTRSKPSTA